MEAETRRFWSSGNVWFGGSLVGFQLSQNSRRYGDRADATRNSRCQEFIGRAVTGGELVWTRLARQITRSMSEGVVGWRASLNGFFRLPCLHLWQDLCQTYHWRNPPRFPSSFLSCHDAPHLAMSHPTSLRQRGQLHWRLLTCRCD